MLGVGWTEMLVIGVIALIVIGPKDLPMVMRRIGQFAGTVRRMGSEFQRELNKTTGLDEIRNLRSSITAPLKQTTEEIRREFNAMTPTGVKPSGVIKPADPNAENVVDEIHAAAGMKPPSETTKALDSAPATLTGGELAPTQEATPPTSSAVAARLTDAPMPPDGEAAEVKKAPVKAKRVTRAKPAPTTPVTVGALPPVNEATADAPKKVPVRKQPKSQPTEVAEAGITPAPEASVLVKKPSTRQKAKTEPQA